MKDDRYDLITYRAPVFRCAMKILNNCPASEIDLLGIISRQGVDSFAAFLIQNGLECLFYTYISEQETQIDELQSVREKLRPNAMIGAARYLSQKLTLEKVHDVLETAGIQYAVFKGAHVRESAYEQPWLRTTADVDVLVSGRDQSKAIEALRGSGMQYHHNPEVYSHEVTLTNLDTSVDLHWHIMRPGRTRTEMTETLLEKTEFAHGYRSMNPTATLFVLLTHPAINKYVCSPDASLVKMMDLCLWTQQPDLDRAELLGLLNTAGLRTAAWSTLYLLSLLTGEQEERELLEELQPNLLQRKYIEFWISRDLPTTFYRYRFLMRVAFGLSLHDRAADILRAVTKLMGYKMQSKR